MVELPEQDPIQGRVDSRNPCPALSTLPLSRAGSRKVDLWGLAFTPLDDSLTFWEPRPMVEFNRLMRRGPWSQEGSAFPWSPELLRLLTLIWKSG